jgi:hypothetical protein
MAFGVEEPLTSNFSPVGSAKAAEAAARRRAPQARVESGRRIDRGS